MNVINLNNGLKPNNFNLKANTYSPLASKKLAFSGIDDFFKPRPIDKPWTKEEIKEQTNKNIIISLGALLTFGLVGAILKNFKK